MPRNWLPWPTTSTLIVHAAVFYDNNSSGFTPTTISCRTTSIIWPVSSWTRASWWTSMPTPIPTCNVQVVMIKRRMVVRTRDIHVAYWWRNTEQLPSSLQMMEQLLANNVLSGCSFQEECHRSGIPGLAFGVNSFCVLLKLRQCPFHLAYVLRMLLLADDVIHLLSLMWPKLNDFFGHGFLFFECLDSLRDILVCHWARR